MSTQSHDSQNLLVSTRYTQEKSRGLRDIKADILKLVYHHPSFRTGLMVYNKRIAIFSVKKTK